MHVCVYLAVFVPCVLASPMFDLNLARTLQTQADKGVPIEQVFKNFKRIFNKTYEGTTEEASRIGIFKANVDYIQQHNLLYAQGTKTYNLAINQFTDLTHREFLTLYTGHLSKRPTSTNGSTFLPASNVELPTTVDWRTHGYVTPVKNQGQCGSCWAFSTTGSLEGQHFKSTGTLLSLSEQQLVDCSGSYGNEGCNGGLMDQAFEYIKGVGGIETEAYYPYTAQDGTCKFNKAKTRATVTGHTDVPAGSETELQKAVAEVGPIAVAIDASHMSFQSYYSGVYYEPDCSSSELDHGVLAVGYGTYEGKAYWLVKNSWGAVWGKEGYIMMARNKDNNCGIATSASYPMV